MLPEARTPRRARLRRFWPLVLLIPVAVIVLAVVQAQHLPEGPQPIAWDAEPCAHCRMLIGAPGFAAQLQTEDGRVLDFDDPGCLLRYINEQHPDVHALWFHHASEDRWLRGDAVAFKRVAESPMGWGLAAVGADEPHDLDHDGAVRYVVAHGERADAAHPGARQ